jgi:hypothetical protein
VPLILLALGACALVNVARGRSAFAIGAVPWRYPGVIVACITAQVTAVYLSGAGRTVVVVASHVAITAWLGLQVKFLWGAVRAAVAVLAFGAFLNLVPIVAHGSMPVSTSAVRSLHLHRAVDISEGHYGKHVAAKGTDPTTWLGDVIPVRPLRAVISLGDIVMMLGIAAASLVAGDGTRRTIALDPRAIGEHDAASRSIGNDHPRDIKIAHGSGR